MTAKTKTHRREKFVLIVRLAARSEAFVEGSGQHRNRYAFINRGLDRPATFSGIGDASGKFCKVGIVNQRVRRQIEQPGRNDAAAPPYFRDVGEVEVELIMLRVAQGRRLGVNRGLF